MKKLLGWFGYKTLDSITPHETERRFQSETWAAATWNRYRALLSLTYRLAIRNRNTSENPARLIPHKAEHNERTRILAVGEEKKLREVILKSFLSGSPSLNWRCTPDCATLSNMALAGRMWTSSIAL